MGPVWDFDIAFGNINYSNREAKLENPEGFFITTWKQSDKYWFARLLEDPVFLARTKERFEYFYSRKADLIAELNYQANYLHYAVEENENKWSTFYTYTWPNKDIWGCYQNEVQCLKQWLITRLDWLHNAFSEM